MNPSLNHPLSIAYLIPEGWEERVEETIEGAFTRWGRLFLCEQPLKEPYFAQNIWLSPQLLSFSSIGEGAKKLKALQRNWALYSFCLHRRSQLVKEKLPYLSSKPLPFPAPLPQAPLGSFTLIDENTLIASPHCSSPFPNGEVHFQESKEPPSRAYLKLWEAFVLLQKWPKKGENCLEIGASPGSWSWVLAKLKAHVLAVDRSPLTPEIASLPSVEFFQGDGFSFTPTSCPLKSSPKPFDWIFCDVACYPEKLFLWVQKWKEIPSPPNMICTLKFQGKEHYAIAKKFAAIPCSKLFHLFHNKHELTFCWIPKKNLL